MIPSLGDKVLIIPYRQTEDTHRHSEETVTKIGRTYFYTDSDTAFERKSDDGCWLDKSTDLGYGHNFRAFPNITALKNYYRRLELIEFMKCTEWRTLDLDKLEKVAEVIENG